MTFALRSDDFVDGGRLGLAHALNGWGHAGENRSPHLAWTGVPSEVKSFALTMYDFTPAGGDEPGWWHWVVFNIPCDCRALSQGAGSGLALLPGGIIQSRTDLGTTGYSGPAPAPGATNRYRFTIYALSAEFLDLDENASGTMVSYLSNEACLARAQIVGLYG